MFDQRMTQNNDLVKKFSLKRLWGRLVFRFAGRNILSHKTIRVRRFYNIIGRFYDWIYTEHIEGYRKSTEFVVHSYVSEQDEVLDLGCGTGALSELAASQAKRIVGVDLSFGMIQQAVKKHKNLPNTHFIVGDCRSLPLGKQFDKIFSGFMMITLGRQDQDQTLRELYSLLTNNGEAIFLTSNENISPHWLSTEDWTLLCREAGFQEVNIEEIFDFFRVIRIRKPPKSSEKPISGKPVASTRVEP